MISQNVSTIVAMIVAVSVINSACWVIFHAFVVLFWLYFKINFFKNFLRNIIRVSNGLDPDQDRQYVGPDLGPNCLQKL